MGQATCQSLAWQLEGSHTQMAAQRSVIGLAVRGLPLRAGTLPLTSWVPQAAQAPQAPMQAPQLHVTAPDLPRSSAGVVGAGEAPGRRLVYWQQRAILQPWMQLQPALHALLLLLLLGAACVFCKESCKECWQGVAAGLGDAVQGASCGLCLLQWLWHKAWCEQVQQRPLVQCLDLCWCQSMHRCEHAHACTHCLSHRRMCGTGVAQACSCGVSGSMSR